MTFYCCRKKHTKLTGILLISALVSTLSGCSQVTSAVSVDNAAVEYLYEQGNTDAAQAADTLNSILKEREEEEIAQITLEEENRFIESVKEALAAGTEPEANGTLIPGKVSTLMDSEVPKLRRVFSDTVIIGNSQAKSIVHVGVLTENEVIYRWAAHVDEIMEETILAANLHRGKTLFILGVNDLGYYCANTEGFKRDYIALIDAYREINPNSEIYLQEIIPIPEEYRFRWYNMDRVPAYNAVLQEICEEKNCTFVSSVRYAMPELIADETGVHYNRLYHIYWAQTMANQMKLWEGQ